MKNIIVRNVTVSARTIASYRTSAGKIDDMVTIWANAGALQAVQHGNLTWLIDLFNVPAMRLQSGALSKLGRDVKGYLAAHVAQFQFDEKAEQKSGIIGAPKLKKMGDKNELKGMFTAIDADGVKQPVAPGDFAMTFAEWKQYASDKAKRSASTDTKYIGKDAAINRLNDIADAASAGKFETMDDMAELYKAFASAKAALDKAAMKARDAKADIDGNANLTALTADIEGDAPSRKTA